MNIPTRLMFAVVACISAPALRADLAADYGSITGTTAGLSVSGWGSPGSVARHGTTAFPILMDANGVSMMAAGRYNDSYASTAACAVVFAHNGPLYGGSDSMPALLEASVKWASRKTTPSTITVGCGSGVSTSFWTSRGYLAKAVTTTMSSSANDLSGVDVFLFDWHSGYSASAVTKIQTFTAGGGGLVCGATPWALGATPTADAYTVLAPFGLTMSGSGWSGPSPATVPAAVPSAYYSALNGSGDLIRDKEGLITMTLANKVIAANSIDQVLAVRTDLAPLNADMETLGDASHYNWITPTPATPIARSTKPVEAMLARYQSNKFDKMTPAQLFAHPCASDFPGTPSAGSTVSRTVPVNGTTATDFYMNQGYKPTRVETGVYAAPGATITVTIPSDKTAAGLQVHIAGNGSEDTTWNIDGWNFFPKLWRRVPLTATSTQTGNVFGGLVTILVPAGSSLGTFNVTVTGALEAPCFVLGTNTDTEWNSGLKNKPAPYGYVKTDKITLYVPKSQLAAMSNPTAVATHWKTVMDTADEYYGYTPWRKRSEAIATSRYVAAGAAYAGYPVEAGWGVDSAEQLDDARVNGSWGNYHELGHGFQDNFNDAFRMPTHAEADVNLFPGMIFNMVHKHTAWDNNSHPSLDASERLVRRADYFALPAAQQTWQVACEGDPINDTGEVVYDFYYNISEAFGWTSYKTAFGRMMNYLQNPTGSTDTDLKLAALNSGDPNYIRNRFYLLFCDATGRNLDTYFQRYGLGKVGAGFEITQSVKDLITSRSYPVWSDNQAITAISNPGTLSLPEATATGTVVHTFSVTDPDPGETHTFLLTSGDPNGDFILNRETGALSVRSLDYERTASYSLTVTAYGDGIPLSGVRSSITRTFTVNVANTVEVPSVTPINLQARGNMAVGTVLGTITAVPETGRTLSAFAIVSGNGSGIFAINSTTGSVTLQLPASLPNPGNVVLTVRVTDSAGQFGYGKVQVACNTPTVLADQQWKLDETSGTTAANGAGGLTGAYENGVVLDQAGARASSGRSVVLDGVNDDVKVLPLGVTSNTFTVTGWIKRNGNQAAWSGLVYTRATGGGGSGMMLGGSNDLRYSWNENYWGYYSGLIVPDNQWCFVALVVEPAKATLYLHDGASMRSSVHNAAQSSAVLNGNWYLGNDPNTSGRLFKGNMDDARMYYRSLSTTEIQQCYDDISAPLTGPSGTTPSASLTAPTNGSSFAAPVSTTMTASVTDNFSNVSKVQFYDGGTLVGEDSTSPYSVTWATSTAGSHPLKARVVYDAGATVDSSVNNVTVTNSLPAGWTGGDIGSVGFTGSSSYSGGVYTISGSGADIWSTADAFHYVSTTLTGDGEIRARVTSQTNTSVWAKAGVMIRESAAPGSAHAMMVISPGNGFAFQYRTTTGGASSHIAGPALNTVPNNWVRLTRSGSLITAYVSANGTAWTQVGQATIAMTAAVTVGLPVTSTNNAATSTATFDNVAVTPYPSPWITADIGSPGLVGRAEFFGNLHTVTGAGPLGGTTDSFRYVYQSLSGDGSVVARVNTLNNTGTSARVGIMVRDTLANNSRMAALSVNGSGAWQWQRRTTAGGSVTTTASSSGTAPNIWVRITRSGNSFTASRSTNGTSWTTISSVTIAMATNCYIGLNVASGTAGTGNTSAFDNITVVP